MNRSYRGIVKQKAHEAANGNSEHDWRDEYEAIEAAVMETPRGRWFLAEYLRRHQHDETRRLLEALRKLMQAQARASEHARTTDVNTASATSPHPEAGADMHENAVLDGMRLLLARTADEVANIMHGAPPAEPTLPDAAASRLAWLLREVHDVPHAALATVTVLSTLFDRLAHMLGEAQPEPTVLPDAPPVELAHSAPEAADPACAPSGRPRTGVATSPLEEEKKEEDDSMAAATPAPTAQGDAEHTAATTKKPRLSEASPALETDAKPASDEKGGKDPQSPRVIIRRLNQSSALDIPLPDASSPDGKGADTTAEKPDTHEENADGKRRRKIIHLAPAQ